MVMRRIAALLLMMGFAALGGGCGQPPAATTAGPQSVSSADGVPIVFEVAGAGETTLVLIHGWACDRTYWRSQVDSFARDYRVVTLDLAGHGGSGTGRAAWSIANFGQDVAAVVARLEAGRVVLVGHSLGGPVALEAGLLLGHRVAAVIGAEAFFDFWTDTSVIRAFTELRGDFAVRTRALVRQAMFTAASPPGLADSVADAMAAAAPEIAMPALDGLVEWAQTRAVTAVPALMVPAGLIMAAGGRQATAGFQRLRGDRPDLGVEEIPGVGHFLMLESPAAFNERLRAMLGRITRQDR